MGPTIRALGTLSAAALLLAACGGASPTSAPTAVGAASNPPAVTTPPASTAPIETQAKLCDDVTQSAPATQVSATVADFTWSSPVEAKVGEVITWKNSDTAPHGVQTDEAGCKMNGSIAANASRSLVFNEAGTFTFFCFVHSGMKGSITIT